MLRYLIAGWGHRLAQGAFPLGTLVVNVVGCFVIGLVGARLSGSLVIREEYRAGLMVGLLGGFTTFSAFGWETLTLANDGRGTWAIANLLLTMTGSLVAVWLGYRASEAWFGA